MTCGIHIKSEGQFHDNLRGDILIVLAGFKHQQNYSKRTRIILNKVARQHSRVFGVEAGTWLLAESGIVNNHQVTTHWEDLERFANRYPELDVVNDRFVIDRSVWTSGGASPTLDMMLHYLSETQHKSLALDVANLFIYDKSKQGQERQIDTALKPLYKREPRIATLVAIMEESIDQAISISEICRRINVSKRRLEQLSQKELGFTPSQFYRRLRLQHARRLVLDTNKAITDIAIESGFTSSSSFSRAFHNHFGVSPITMRSN